MKMEVEKRIHNLWKEKEEIIRKHPELSDVLPIGKYQYIYRDTKGTISLIELPNYFRDGKTLWEIYCLKGQLFEDVERFNSKEEAEERIKELLT